MAKSGHTYDLKVNPLKHGFTIIIFHYKPWIGLAILAL